MDDQIDVASNEREIKLASRIEHQFFSRDISVTTDGLFFDDRDIGSFEPSRTPHAGGETPSVSSVSSVSSVRPSKSHVRARASVGTDRTTPHFLSHSIRFFKTSFSTNLFLYVYTVRTGE